MAEIIKDITVDVAQSNILGTQNYITAKQGDKGSRFVRARLANEGVDINIDPTATVMLNAYKSDGTRADKIGKVNSDGSVTAEITSQMLAKEGQVDCDISIIDKDGTKLTTTTFFVQVQPASIPDGSIVSSDDYSVITDLLLRVQAVDENETARQEAEAERVAENERVKTVINSFSGTIPLANTVTPGAVKQGGDIEIKSPGIVTLVNAVKLEIVKMNNPVGTIRYFAVATNPATLLGFGTWAQIAKGRTIVGVDTADSDFNSIGKQGGEKSHKLTLAELPSFNIDFRINIDHYQGDVVTGEYINAGLANGECRRRYFDSTDYIGGNQPHNNLPPYECYYIWKRTA